MNYTQIKVAAVMNVVAQGFNVVICDFKDNVIKYTNDLTVSDIRNYISQPDVAFFKIEEIKAANE